SRHRPAWGSACRGTRLWHQPHSPGHPLPPCHTRGRYPRRLQVGTGAQGGHPCPRTCLLGDRERLKGCCPRRGLASLGHPVHRREVLYFVVHLAADGPPIQRVGEDDGGGGCAI